MKKSMMKSVSLLLALSLLTGCSITASNPEDGGNNASSQAENSKDASGEASTTETGSDVSDVSASKEGSGDNRYSVTEKTMPLYYGEYDNKQDLKVYFVNETGVPYISIDVLPHLLEDILDGDHQYEISTGQDADVVTITRKGSPYTADFDFENDTVTFLDYDAFMKVEDDAIVAFGGISLFTDLFQQVEELTNDRYGKTMCFDLKPYEIDLVRADEGYLIPLQTFSDLLMSYYNAFSLYNGESVIIAGALDKELDREYYSSKPERTEEYAAYDYHELCFALDNLYGLKEIHDIDSFDEYFDEIGVKKRLMGTDQTAAEAALYEFITCYLDDLHSKYKLESCGTDFNEFLKQIEGIKGPWMTKYENWIGEFYEARDQAYPDGILPYEEVGNTAYITFDSFVEPMDDFDYLSEPTEEELHDTVRLMQYSYDRITREGSPVKNVVLDLSVNTGGSINAACYTIGMFLGMGSINVKNTMTGAATTSQYRIDANRDGKFDEKDTLATGDYNLYCLVSPVSFSCGNLLPNEFMMDPHVTLIGKTTGGGSCSFMGMSTAGGVMFQISGYRRMSVFKNGSFYDIDRGANPDIFIDKISRYYDRKSLTKMINDL